MVTAVKLMPQIIIYIIIVDYSRDSLGSFATPFSASFGAGITVTKGSLS